MFANDCTFRCGHLHNVFMGASGRGYVPTARAAPLTAEHILYAQAAHYGHIDPL